MPVTIHVPGNFRNHLLITGFHGVGLTGYIASAYLVHTLKAQRIGYIEVASPPPWVTTSEDGLVTPFEVYSSKKLVVVRLEFAPHRSEEAEFARKLAEWAVRQKFKEAVLVGGLDSRFRIDREDACIVPTSAYVNGGTRLKAPLLEPGLLVYGPLAIVLSHFEMRNFPAVAVLPFAETSRADPSAAAVAIRRICNAYKIRIRTADLEREAKLIEQEHDRRLAQTTKAQQGLYV